MSEPEEVIIEGAHAATTFAARLWRRHRPGPPRVELAEVRPRLELLVGALFGDVPPIIVAEPPARPSFAGRIVRRIPRHLLDDRAHASTDGAHIRLPRVQHGEQGRDAAVSAYRVLAVEQAARAARGTPSGLTPGMPPELHDLYALSEAVAIDLRLAAELPGLVQELCDARRRALAERPSMSALTEREQHVESMLRLVLTAHPGAPPAELLMATSAVASPISMRVAATPSASLAWARERADELASLRGRYRGLPPVAMWGRALPRALDAPPLRGGPAGGEPDPRVAQDRVRTRTRRPRIRPSPDDEDDGQMGMLMIQLDDPQEHVEDPLGLQRPADTDQQKDADDLADSLSELPEARLVCAPGTPAEVLASDDPPPRRAAQPDAEPRRVGIAYPEWDYRIAAYHPGRAVVRELPARRGTAHWVQDVRRRHAREIEQVRRRFERLRPQRVRLGRQLDGSDVDIAAYTVAHADARAGRGGEDRLYEAVRPVRRDIAISLLVDISGSTDSWLSEQRRIIDVEKEAVLLVGEALDALGDRWAVTAFSGEGPEAVAMQSVKRFDERYGDAVRLRIAGLEHDRYTRMGAALRHATALLCRQSARHRLLLLLTDGKPNDVDIYEGRYGVEDTRQAVVEARLQAVHPYCLTVDREAPSYLPRMFGPWSWAVLRRADTLPRALVEVVRRLLEG
ncbi:MAG TPA: VWA domain-containing protein [Gemmatimonadaceae bacterium]|nr:VWA domain-containing protein [Gemmatimonadaceae bacterium]